MIQFLFSLSTENSSLLFESFSHARDSGFKIQDSRFKIQKEKYENAIQKKEKNNNQILEN